jgi:transcriptional regulator with XRE-family HTH domain
VFKAMHAPNMTHTNSKARIPNESKFAFLGLTNVRADIPNTGITLPDGTDVFNQFPIELDPVRGPMDQAKLFGKRLKALRKARKLSQAQLAERIDVGEKFLGDLETARRSPSFETVVSIAKELDVPVYDLFYFDKDGDDPKAVRRRLDSLLNRCSSQQVRQIYGHARCVLEG